MHRQYVARSRVCRILHLTLLRHGDAVNAAALMRAGFLILSNSGRLSTYSLLA
jgi:hypothetical protein